MTKPDAQREAPAFLDFKTNSVNLLARVLRALRVPLSRAVFVFRRSGPLLGILIQVPNIAFATI